MQRLGEDFLAGPRFALDQDFCLLVSQALGRVEDARHAAAAARELVEHWVLGFDGRFRRGAPDGRARTPRRDPLGAEFVDMWPLVNLQALDKVAGLIERDVAAGAEAVTCGIRADVGQSFHFQPTLLANCRGDMEIMHKEIFGPVLPVQVVDSLDEAIAEANDSDFGLTSSIFTTNLNVARQAVRDLRFGETYVNREHFEAMQRFHAGRRKSDIGGADSKNGLNEYMETHVT